MRKKMFVSAFLLLLAFVLVSQSWNPFSTLGDVIQEDKKAAIGEPISFERDTSKLQIESLYETEANAMEYGIGHTAAEIIAKYNIYKPKTVTNEFIVEPKFTPPHVAGIPSDVIIENGINAVNFMRYIAGLPDDITIKSSYSDLAQHGATLLADKGEFTHFPSKPADMEESFYQKGYSGTSSSNLAVGFLYIEDSIRAYMQDWGDNNLSRVGHRRWILNPSMKQTGLGYSVAIYPYGTCNYYAMYAFDSSRIGVPSDYDSVAWPSKGAFPIQYTEDYDELIPWSISLNPLIYDNNKKTEIKVKVTNAKTGSYWEGDGNRSYNITGREEYFNIETSYYGVPFCIIFRPTVTKYNAGDIYDVEITGVYKKGQSTPTSIKYSTYFFDLNNPGVIDTQNPTVVSVSPAYNKSNVSIKETIAIKFSEPIRIEGIPHIKLNNGISDVAVDYYVGTGANDKDTLYIKPSNQLTLTYSTAYTLTIPRQCMKDFSGNPWMGIGGNDLSLSFSTTSVADCNLDGKVNIDDLVLLSLAYGSTQADIRWDARADLNGDGRISILDVNIMASAYVVN